MHTDFDVAIAGYGPTGLVAASALGAKGHRVLVVERWPGLYGMPRLTHIDGETARIIQHVGDVDDALRVARPVDSYTWLSGDGETLLTVDWSGTSSGYPAHFSIYQPDIEDAIDARVRSFPNVTVKQGWNLNHVEQDDERVVLRIRPWSRDRNRQWTDTGESETFTARYLIAADGANSFVRESLGIDRDDLHSDDVWLNIDTEQLGDLPDRFAQSSQFCDPARPHMFMPIGFGRQRFEVAVLPGDDVEEAKTLDHAWRWLRDTHGIGPDDVRILRNIVYTFSARTAERWRDGRVLLGGDAAHTMPPYMGQGACSGMRDGLTAAWKLDLVLRGLADERLLDTYEAERRPHAGAIQATSVFLGRLANTLDADEAAERDAMFRSGDAPPPPPFPTIVAGVIRMDAAGAPIAPAGELAPQGRVRAGDRSGLFDNVVGAGLSLVARDDPRALLDAERLGLLEALGATIGTTAPGTPWSFEDLDGVYAAFFAEHDAAAFISRPDFHLFGAAAAEELPGLVDELGLRLSLRAVPAVAAAPAVPAVPAGSEA